MADNPYLTDGFIDSMKRRGWLPAGSGMTSSQILAIASEEQGLYVMALLKSIREEFCIASLDIAVTASTVPFPQRSAGAALRTITWFPSSGSAADARPLVRIEPERYTQYDMNGSEPVGFMFQGNDLILVPGVSSGTLRVSYQQRLSRLVLPDSCGQITAINTSTRVVTINRNLTTFITSELFDFVSNTPNFVVRGMDRAVSGISTGSGTMDLTFSTALPSSLAVGDWVCLASETPVPQLPTEVHTLLAARTAEAILTAQGSQRLPAIQGAVAQARADAVMLLSPRSDGSARPIIRRDGLGRRW